MLKPSMTPSVSLNDAFLSLIYASNMTMQTAVCLMVEHHIPAHIKFFSDVNIIS